MPLPAAFEANNIVARNRSPYWHRWGRWLRFRRQPQRQQRSIDRVNERRYFLWWKAVFLDVTADDLGDQ